MAANRDIAARSAHDGAAAIRSTARSNRGASAMNHGSAARPAGRSATTSDRAHVDDVDRLCEVVTQRSWMEWRGERRFTRGNCHHERKPDKASHKLGQLLVVEHRYVSLVFHRGSMVSA
jgi:hypothetical protein